MYKFLRVFADVPSQSAPLQIQMQPCLPKMLVAGSKFTIVKHGKSNFTRLYKMAIAYILSIQKLRLKAFISIVVEGQTWIAFLPFIQTLTKHEIVCTASFAKNTRHTV